MIGYLKEVEMAMRSVGDGETMRVLREGMDLVRLLAKTGQGFKIIENQTTQEEWFRIDTSRYCPEYMEREKIVG